METHYITQVLHTGAQLVFLILCFGKLRNQKSNILLFIFIPSFISFIQTFINFWFHEIKIFVSTNIAIFILIETFFHFSIIQNFVNKKTANKIKFIKAVYCIGILVLLLAMRKNYSENIWLSYIPILLILIFGVFALKNILKNNTTTLLFNSNFWIVYSIIFIQLSSLPIEVINFLFVDAVSFETSIVKIKAHQISYFLYHSILIYAMLWIPKKSI